MSRRTFMPWIGLAIFGPAIVAVPPVLAEDLYAGGAWPAMATDRRAGDLGDIVTVAIFSAASATNRVQNNSSKSTKIGGSINVGSIDESADLDFGGRYAGAGEVRRTEQLVAQMTATVVEVLRNGDFIIQGVQQLNVNGETTFIGVRGRIRASDISAENIVPSVRIADAKIDYDGKGFVSRSAKPGLINRIFSFLGLG